LFRLYDVSQLKCSLFYAVPQGQYRDFVNKGNSILRDVGTRRRSPDDSILNKPNVCRLQSSSL